MKHLLISIAIITFFVFLSYGDTIHVPDDYSRIQDGIDAAVDGDTVLVAKGMYTGTGNRDLLNPWKKIYLISESGPDSTVIDCEHLSDGLHFYSDGDALFEGFTITHGFHGLRCSGSNDVIIRNCIIIENDAGDGGSVGGGIYNSGSVSIVDCLISGNHATLGGGISCCGSWISPLIYNCEITHNTASMGGALYYREDFSFGNSMDVTGCTIYGNTAGNDGGVAYVNGVSYSYSNPVLVMNSCIIRENSEPYFDFSHGGSAELSYTDIEDGWQGLGNIDADPLFIDPLNGDFRLQPDSPCIDTGDPELPPRHGGGHTRHDMGAHEYCLWFDYYHGTLYTVRRVPADYPTIQSAIDASAPYDTIVVAPGTYSGEGNINIEFFGKPLTVRSESGPEVTVIDCEYEPDSRGFRLTSSEDCGVADAIIGFTIKRAPGYGIANEANLLIEKCVIIECASEDRPAIYSCSDELIVSCCIISNNTVEIPGITAGLMIEGPDGFHGLIINSKFISNAGTVIRCFDISFLEIVNCTITDNTNGYGLRISYDTEVTVQNSIFWNNEFGEIYIQGSSPDLTINYSNIMGGWEGEGNIDTDPLFRDPGSGDYHLSAFSPCIDAADGNVAPRLDLDGTLRLDDPLVPNTGLGPPWVDMGAYERAGIIHLLRRGAGE